MDLWEKLKEIGNRFLAHPVVKISPAEMSAAMLMMSRLKLVHGWCPEAAATATAMAMSESSFNPGVEGDKSLQDHAHGLFQWRGSRFQALETYAAKTARHWSDVNTQIDFFNEERLKRSKLEKEWHTLIDLQEGCFAGYRYEVYSGPIQPKREAYAEEFLFEWQGRHN
jgi:Phage tail lysozyme